MKKILVTGGGGYVGSVLVKKLLALGYFVRVLDLFLYDRDPFREIPDSHKKRLEIMRGDIRKIGIVDFSCMDMDVVIHLACISNDPSFDLNPKLGRSVNLDAFEPLVKMAKNSGVERFINASSSSVYGVSEELEVIEETKCLPLTDYSKFKLETEDILLDFEEPHFTTVSVRSATVCGYSPRQRLDVIVNILTNHAHNKGEITVMGGGQTRPNIHIEDLTDFYVHLVEAPATKITGDVFNYGGPNYTVQELAMLVREVYFPKIIQIKFKETNDPRSYRISSKKAKNILGVEPKHTIMDAVKDLRKAFDGGFIPHSLTDSKYFNIEKMKELGVS